MTRNESKPKALELETLELRAVPSAVAPLAPQTDTAALVAPVSGAVNAVLAHSPVVHNYQLVTGFFGQ